MATIWQRAAQIGARQRAAQIGAWHEWYCTPVVATCRQTVEALLAPLSTAWQRLASAPVKAIELLGGSPNQGNRYHPVTKSNCVAARQGGEQLEVNEQSVTKVNSIRPSLSGSVLVIHEPLTAQMSQ